MRTRQLVIFLLGLGDTRVSESAAEGSGGGLLGSDGRSHGCLVAGTFTLGGTGNSAECHVEEEFGGELIHVYVWLSHLAVHLKLSQHVNQLYPITKLKKTFLSLFFS